MKCLLFCAVLSLSLPAFGQSPQASTSQQAWPDSASTSKVAADNTSIAPFVVQPIHFTPPALLIQSGPARERKRVADRGFILTSLFQIGATIGDIESTQYGLSHGAREANSLYGSHPSRTTQYAIAMPLAAAVVVGVIASRKALLIPGTGSFLRWLSARYTLGRFVTISWWQKSSPSPEKAGCPDYKKELSGAPQHLQDTGHVIPHVVGSVTGGAHGATRRRG
jgi:hypothetical protein